MNWKLFDLIMAAERERQLKATDDWLATFHTSDQTAYTAGFDAAYFHDSSWPDAVASPNYPSSERFRTAFRAGFEYGEMYHEQETQIKE